MLKSIIQNRKKGNEREVIFYKSYFSILKKFLKFTQWGINTFQSDMWPFKCYVDLSSHRSNIDSSRSSCKFSNGTHNMLKNKMMIDSAKITNNCSSHSKAIIAKLWWLMQKTVGVSTKWYANHYANEARPLVTQHFITFLCHST